MLRSPLSSSVSSPVPCHQAEQKILNWKQSLRFPSRPRVSHEGVNLMQQLLCEPEDRLGSQTPPSVSRPELYSTYGRRSGFMRQAGSPVSVDGAHLIKVCPEYSRSRSRAIHVCAPCRLIPGSRVSTGTTSTVIPHLIARNLQALKIQGTLIQTFLQR